MRPSRKHTTLFSWVAIPLLGVVAATSLVMSSAETADATWQGSRGPERVARSKAVRDRAEHFREWQDARLDDRQEALILFSILRSDATP